MRAAGWGRPEGAFGWDLEEKGRVLLNLYEKAAACMREAIELIEAGEMVEKGKRLIQAQDIVLLLSDALDEKAAPGSEVLSGNLRRLYLYLYRLLVRGNNELDVEAILEARRLMEKLYSAWSQVVEEGTAFPPGRASG